MLICYLYIFFDEESIKIFGPVLKSGFTITIIEF